MFAQDGQTFLDRVMTFRTQETSMKAPFVMFMEGDTYAIQVMAVADGRGRTGVGAPSRAVLPSHSSTVTSHLIRP